MTVCTLCGFHHLLRYHRLHCADKRGEAESGNESPTPPLAPASTIAGGATPPSRPLTAALSAALDGSRLQSGATVHSAGRAFSLCLLGAGALTHSCFSISVPLDKGVWLPDAAAPAAPRGKRCAGVSPLGRTGTPASVNALHRTSTLLLRTPRLCGNISPQITEAGNRDAL